MRYFDGVIVTVTMENTHQRWKRIPREERDHESHPREEEYPSISVERIEDGY